MNSGEIIIYQPDDNVKLEVLLNSETVWLNRQQLATLFDRDIKTIGKHIGNALAEELKGFPTVAKFATVQQEGNRTVTRNIEYYNLDMVVSVGYRVKSQRGIRFRQWANQVLKDYLLRGYSINQRLLNIEHKVEEHERKIDFFVRTSLPPVEGIFFDGQIYDAYKLASRLVRSAKSRIILIDNYIDESVLTLLDKRGEGVEAQIYTQQIGPQMQLDIRKHDSQYPPIPIHLLSNAHDRFLLIDNDVYHIGASLKDLGKRWFAIMRMQETKADVIIQHLV